MLNITLIPSSCMDEFITYIFEDTNLLPKIYKKYFKMSTGNLELHCGKNSNALWENAFASHNNNVDFSTLI